MNNFSTSQSGPVVFFSFKQVYMLISYVCNTSASSYPYGRGASTLSPACWILTCLLQQAVRCTFTAAHIAASCLLGSGVCAYKCKLQVLHVMK